MDAARRMYDKAAYKLSDAKSIADDNSRRIKMLDERLHLYRADPHYRVRLTKGSCRYCFYIDPEGAQQGPKERHCEICSKEIKLAGDRSAKICSNCSTEYGVCRFCGSWLNNQSRSE